MGRMALAFAISFAFSSPARAHRLEVDCLGSGAAIKVEVFYPGDGTPARGARVAIQDAGGGLVAEGLTDERGACTFAISGAGPFAVVAEHGGHRATAAIEPSREPAAEESGRASGEPGAAGTRIRREPFPVVEAIAGAAFIFGLAGFVLAVSALRRARALRGELDRLRNGADHAP